MRCSVPGALALVALAATLLAGEACESRLPHPPYVGHTTSDLEAAGYPPPPARVEFIPRQPTKAAAWIDGEWSWQGKRWRWRMGRWVEPPAGARFAPWAIVRGADGTLYSAPGAWRDAQGREVPEPASLATGKTNLADVVDPEGNLETSGPSLRPEPSDAAADARDADEVPTEGTGDAGAGD